MIREGLSRETMFEQRSSGESVPGRKESKCKSPEAGMSLVGLRDSEREVRIPEQNGRK